MNHTTQCTVDIDGAAQFHDFLRHRLDARFPWWKTEKRSGELTVTVCRSNATTASLHAFVRAAWAEFVAQREDGPNAA